MATIPTYNRQQTKVTAPQYIHTDSTLSAAVGGAVAGLQQGAQVAQSIQRIAVAKEQEQAQAEREQARIEQEAYNINLAPRMDAINKSTLDLNQQNMDIRKQMASAPNPQKANELLEQKFNDILSNPPEGLDEKSLQDWQKAILSERHRLQMQNLHWGETAAAQAGKAAAAKANNDLFNLRKNDARYAGKTGTGYSDGQLDIDKNGAYTERHIPSMNPDDKKLQDVFHSEHLLGQAEVPLETDKADPAIKGILGDNLDEMEGVAPTGTWPFKKKGETKQEIGEKKINEYFDKVRENIDNSGLGNSAKNALKSYTDAQERARKREFNAYIKAGNLETQKQMGALPDPTFVSEYFANKRAEQKADADLLELNPITTPTTVSELRGADDLANFTFGNDYESVATRFSYTPMGNVDDFSAELNTALATLNIPVGEYTREELYSKYAPNGTINERQAIESLVKDNPNIKITDADMNYNDSATEFNWAVETISDVASMPTNTDEEKERKQAAVNHTIYQAQKELNQGRGFSSPELTGAFTDFLIGQQQQQDGTVNYAPLVNDDAVINEMQKVGMLVGNPNTNKYFNKKAVAIIGRGLMGANKQYRETNDIGQYKNNIKQINQDVLSERYRGVLDLPDLQVKLDNKEPALFTFNGKPYEYMGFSGNDIFIKSGNKKSKLGE